jgi:hypothetical protein
MRQISREESKRLPTPKQKKPTVPIQVDYLTIMGSGWGSESELGKLQDDHAEIKKILTPS